MQYQYFWCSWWWNTVETRKKNICCPPDKVFQGFLTLTTFRISGGYWDVTVKMPIPAFASCSPSFFFPNLILIFILNRMAGSYIQVSDRNEMYNACCNKASRFNNNISAGFSKCLHKNTSLQWSELWIHPKLHNMACICAILIHTANWLATSLHLSLKMKHLINKRR